MYPQQIASVALIAPATGLVKTLTAIGIDIKQWKIHRFVVAYMHDGRLQFVYIDHPMPRKGELPNGVGEDYRVMAYDLVDDLSHHAESPLIKCPVLLFCGK